MTISKEKKNKETNVRTNNSRLHNMLNELEHTLRSLSEKKLTTDSDYQKLKQNVLTLIHLLRKDIVGPEQSIHRKKNHRGLTYLNEKPSTERAPLSAEQVIPIEFQTLPVSLKIMVSAMRPTMSVYKLGEMIKHGHYHVMQINRQSWIFDTRELRPEVLEKLKELR